MDATCAAAAVAAMLVVTARLLRRRVRRRYDTPATRLPALPVFLYDAPPRARSLHEEARLIPELRSVCRRGRGSARSRRRYSAQASKQEAMAECQQCRGGEPRAAGRRQEGRGRGVGRQAKAAKVRGAAGGAGGVVGGRRVMRNECAPAVFAVRFRRLVGTVTREDSGQARAKAPCSMSKPRLAPPTATNRLPTGR